MVDAKTGSDAGRLFHELGLRIEERWRKANYNDLALAEIAEQELREAALNERVTYLDVIRWLDRCPHLPRQFNMEATFGQPPITVFSTEHFYIDVLNWLDGTTSVHRHSFSGAFQVLNGSSIHAQWDFESHLRVNPSLTLGKLKDRSIELLREGDIRQILPADKLIHSVFHLNHPSVTIVVRSMSYPGAQPQYTYLRPHIEIDLYAKGDACARRMQALKMLWNLKHPAYDEELLAVLRNSDAFSALLVLEQHLGLESDLAKLGPVLGVMQEVHPQLLEYLLPCALVLQRQEHVHAKRTSLTDLEHRFFLAVSMNATNPRAAMDLVKLWAPERDPVEVVVGWVRQIAAGAQAALLDFEFDTPALRALEGLLRGTPVDVLKRQMEVDDGRAAQILGALPYLPLFRPFLGEE